MNLANLLTIFRIVVLPFIVFFVYRHSADAAMWALILLIIAIATDFLDGYFARRRKEETKVGSFLDPFADKLLVIVLLLVFVLRGDFWLTVLILFIVRDITTFIIRWLASNDDIWIKDENYRKLLIYSQYAVCSSILLSLTLSLNRLSEWIATVDGLVIIFTIAASIIAILSIIHPLSVYLRGLHGRRQFGKKLRQEKLVILANKKSRGYFDGYRRRLLKIFAKRRGLKVKFLPRNKKNMFDGVEERVGEAKHVIIAGGDGSFEGALNCKQLQKKSLGFFPFGAGNAYYSYFYKGKRFEYLRSRFTFNEAPLDILQVEWEKGKVQTTFFTLGIDAEVMRMSRERTQHGLWDYVSASARALFKARADFDLECTIDGKKHDFENCVNFTLAKIPYYGFAMRSLFGEVQPDDGNVYGLALVNTHSTFLNKGLRLWALLQMAFGIEKNPLLSLQGKKFEIRSEVPFPIQAGGEFLGFTQWVKVRVKRKQKVLVI